MSEQLAIDWRNSDPDTSRLASIHSMPNRLRDRDLAIEALRCAGERGLTDFELAHAVGVAQTSIGKRRLELERDGLVAGRMVIDGLELRQDRRRAPSGAWALVWVAIEYQRANAS
jgi:hypothetical protein